MWRCWFVGIYGKNKHFLYVDTNFDKWYNLRTNVSTLTLFKSASSKREAPHLAGSQKSSRKKRERRTTMKYGSVTLGQIEAMINKIKRDVGEEGVELLLADELVISRKERKLRSVETVEICISATPKSSSKGILKKYDFLRSVEKDDSPEGEIVMTLATVLREDEGSVSGSEYELRLQKISGILGYSQAVWLVENQDKLPKEFMDLLGKIYVDFPATVAVDVDGCQCVPYLHSSVGRWFLGWRWLVGGFRSHDRIAGSRK